LVPAFRSDVPGKTRVRAQAPWRGSPAVCAWGNPAGDPHPVNEVPGGRRTPARESGPGGNALPRQFLCAFGGSAIEQLPPRKHADTPTAIVEGNQGEDV